MAIVVLVVVSVMKKKKKKNLGLGFDGILVLMMFSAFFQALMGVYVWF